MANSNKRKGLPSKAALSVYNLPSTQKIMRYPHADLRFTSKATMLKAIQNGWLVRCLGLTVNSVNIFSESNETQQGHMKQQRQGVRSTNPREKRN